MDFYKILHSHVTTVKVAAILPCSSAVQKLNTWHPPAVLEHIPLQQAYRDRPGDIRVVGLGRGVVLQAGNHLLNVSDMGEVEEYSMLRDIEYTLIKIEIKNLSKNIFQSTGKVSKLTFFPLLILVGVSCLFVATQT